MAGGFSNIRVSDVFTFVIDIPLSRWLANDNYAIGTKLMFYYRTNTVRLSAEGYWPSPTIWFKQTVLKSLE